MVVDDDRDILLITVRSLENCGFPVDSFNDPIKALAHFEQHANEYALVLSDIRMPGMSGMQFLNAVKRVRPDISIMAMTAYEADDEIVGAVPWIRKEEIMHKPFRLMEICTSVKQVLHLPA